MKTFCHSLILSFAPFSHSFLFVIWLILSFAYFIHSSLLSIAHLSHSLLLSIAPFSHSFHLSSPLFVIRSYYHSLILSFAEMTSDAFILFGVVCVCGQVLYLCELITTNYQLIDANSKKLINLTTTKAFKKRLMNLI